MATVVVRLIGIANGKLSVSDYYGVITDKNLLAKKAFTSLVTDFSKLSASIIAVSALDFFFEELALAEHFFFLSFAVLLQRIESFQVLDPILANVRVSTPRISSSSILKTSALFTYAA